VGGAAALRCRSIRPAILLALVLAGIGSVPARAQQNPEDELGNWLIYNGTVRFSDRWSMFTEAQVRLWEVDSNLNEWFVRAVGQYDLSPQAIVGLGYNYGEARPFGSGPVTTENRLFEQFAIRHEWARSLFEHRYRLEQRWREEAGNSSYSNRFRYRLQVTTPLNMEAMKPGAHFINVYNEIFLNFDSERTFDQNRLYAAWGHQFTPVSNLQLGLLWQARTMEDFFRLQIFYTHNFNLHERDGS
jgi:hypothetical protein